MKKWCGSNVGPVFFTGPGLLPSHTHSSLSRSLSLSLSSHARTHTFGEDPGPDNPNRGVSFFGCQANDLLRGMGGGYVRVVYEVSVPS